MDKGSTRGRQCRCSASLILAGFALACAFLSPLFSVQAQVRDERAVKAAFVYNLTKYVEWPQLNNDIVIGIISEDSTGEIFRAMLDGKTSDSRTIRILLSPSDQELAHCNLVYVADATQNSVRVALDRVRKRGVLTVGDAELFTREGGMIGLVTVADHVQIRVNLQQTRESGLKISSRLLSIAVVSQPGSGRD